MAGVGDFFPLEVLIPGVPVSHQARPAGRAAWQEKVRGAATERRNHTSELGWSDARPVSVLIYYFADALMQGDVDNIVKPILDGLETVCYLDDNQVERVTVQKFEPTVEREFLSLSDQLAAALDAEPPLVYIRIDDDLGWRTIS
ncbi:RusA family crossover junction endodeoxyribonuclease [Glycocaulis abyssi]|uniref:RusA family crossover junction endodeoxyribonuclease n=1 Tax=Glycocaulis abyssi TaxID=1433403 RepID=A0ABV9N877_9PROT